MKPVANASNLASPAGAPAEVPLTSSAAACQSSGSPGSFLIDIEPSNVVATTPNARAEGDGVLEPQVQRGGFSSLGKVCPADEGVCNTSHVMGSVDVRLPYERPKSKKFHRASSYQCHVSLEGWLRAFPQLTLQDLGPGFSSGSFENSQGLRLATYAWRQQGTPKGAIVLFHSYTSYTLFDFLRHQPPNRPLDDSHDEAANWVPKYPGSWVEGFYRLGLNVYALDHQSHGRSEGWRMWRCIVSKFDCLVDDALQFLNEYVATDESLAPDVPIVLLGYSMGGNVVIQTLGRIHNGEKEAVLRERVNQAIFLAPLIKIRLDFKTHLMVRLNRSLISCCMPNLRISRADNSGDCPFLGWWYQRDPFTYSGRTKSRMVAALYDASRKVPKVIRKFPHQLKLLCLQGTNDQTVDFHAPLRLYESPVRLDLLYLCGWSHYIPKHSGAERLLGLVITWLAKTLGGKVHPHSPHMQLFSLTPERLLPSTATNREEP
ncbi:uncharacterized protein LOC34624477 [Cyclospora cayetanensis]|uniref:Uncharacterized protein LOC34624477 n=2 Tax=Cyclospora cayetanensis TaxID=88456 RepID=A0A6P5WE02_9EIME|nr:uncharacterized protein LOC34624477 [Cyclospora cayetanensis]OEH77001.1 putative acylglycerol lipase [Cyclospora cayetanensis]